MDNELGNSNENTQIATSMVLREVGDYELLNLLGIGGMGEVFLARQKSIGRQVAVKILLPALANNQCYLDRFFREVRTLAKVEHPGVVMAIEAGFDKNVCFFSMMYADGSDLMRMLNANGVFDEREALGIIRQVAVALDYVWDKHRIIHRDIKPANIILTKEHQVKILDMGISKIDVDNDEDDEELTRVGTMIGSPYYISPEQARDDKIDFRTDMYSLGVTLYVMLTQKTPFNGTSTLAIVTQHFEHPVPDPREINQSLSSGTVALIEKMMAKQPDKRYPSWRALIKTIDQLDQKISASRQTSSQPALSLNTLGGKFQSAMADWRIFYFTAALVIAVALLVIGLLLNRVQQEYRFREQGLENIIKFAENCSPEQRGQAIRKLHYLINNGSAVQAERGQKLLSELHRAIRLSSADKIELKVKDALQTITSQAVQLEKQHKYAAAADLWRYYLKNSPLHKHKLFIKEAEKAIIYFEQMERDSREY
ncbi:MAG: serine/threonine protein kinase [Victivallaceae bacterium]|nr:serine/threonine protein kinase [Victivallaceae bacterium]